MNFLKRLCNHYQLRNFHLNSARSVSKGISALDTEEEGFVCTFGSKKRTEKCLRAEDYVNSWRSLLHPVNACGSRSYALLGCLSSYKILFTKKYFFRIAY